MAGDRAHRPGCSREDHDSAPGQGLAWFAQISKLVQRQKQTGPESAAEVIVYHAMNDPRSVHLHGLSRSHSTYSDGCIWLARYPELAKYFGDYVFAVDMMGLANRWPLDDKGKPDWQAHYNLSDIPPCRLTELPESQYRLNLDADLYQSPYLSAFTQDSEPHD